MNDTGFPDDAWLASGFSLGAWQEFSLHANRLLLSKGAPKSPRPEASQSLGQF